MKMEHIFFVLVLLDTPKIRRLHVMLSLGDDYSVDRAMEMANVCGRKTSGPVCRLWQPTGGQGDSPCVPPDASTPPYIYTGMCVAIYATCRHRFSATVIPVILLHQQRGNRKEPIVDKRNGWISSTEVRA